MAPNHRRAERERIERGGEICASLDNFAPLRNGLRQLAKERGEWAGMPMPMQDHRLVVEPTYPNAQALMAFGGHKFDETAPPDDTVPPPRQRNVFYSRKRQCDVVIWDEHGADGTKRIEWGLVPKVHGADHLISTLGASVAWGIEQEARAIDLLGTLIKHHTFKHYMLTGMFLEHSERSGVMYLFRRLRPTVAMKPSRSGESMRILCCLCLHPIAYYSDSWAGAMCPTDDVIAHLMLMRGDEVMFWRRANQHPPYRPEAGLS